MESDVLKHFTFNYKEIVIDEIALEGLEGITFDMLWRRIEHRISAPVTPKLRARLWTLLVNNDAISFYQLPEPRPSIEIIDRFYIVNSATGQLLDPSDYLDGPYEYSPVKDDYGSCVHYETRTPLSKEDFKNVNCEKIFNEYRDTLVLVASTEERWKAIAPHNPITIREQLTSLQYCMVELVGRARENGQTTMGMSNLPKIIKEPKLLFYNRKNLQELGLLKAQSIAQISGQKAGRTLLIRLSRFYKPTFLTLPKEGIICNIIQNLLKQPNQTDTTEAMLEKGVMKSGDWKRILKSNLFKCEKRDVHIKDKIITNRFVTINDLSDESEVEEEVEESLPCQYKVKVSLVRQAYERILEGGNRGLTLLELGKVLGIEFYTSRMIIRLFKKKNLVKEYYEDKGRIRVGRYVASSKFCSTGTQYDEERKKFMEFVEESKKAPKRTLAPAADVTTESDSEIPRKKIKLEGNNQQALESITETKFLTQVKCPTMLDANKKPTLRQLKYANAILKVLKEKKVVPGTQLLNILASREANEPQMDNKNLKAFTQSLANTGQLKIMIVAWPGYENKHTVLFTDPHIQTTDSVVRSKYREIYVRAIKNMKVKEEPNQMTNLVKRPWSFFSNPRYTRLRRLHTFLMNVVYFEGSKNFHTSLPKGFTSFVEVLPEFTVEFAIGNIPEKTLEKLPKAKTIHSMFPLKLADVPSEIFRIFVTCNGLESGCIANVRLLALCGLVQLVEDQKEFNEFKTPIGHVFYLNRKASIIDTTGEWPRENADKEALKKFYHFESLEDVERFWDDVCNISTNTTITLETSERQRRNIPKEFTPKERVYEQDNGQILGNGLGPCGFDSTFFMDVPRLWADSSLYMKKAEKKKVKRRKRGALVKNKPSKPCLTSFLEPPPSLKKTQPIKDVNSTKKNRVRIRIWPAAEDDILMLCKAALTIVSPVAQPGCITLRNTIIKYLFTIMGQKHLIKHVKKRIEQQDLDPSIMYKRDCIINELKRRSHLMRRYEGVYDKFKREYGGNLQKAISATRVPMLELVWTLRQLMNSKSFNQKVPCVATSLDEFNKNYYIYTSNVNSLINSYKTPPGADPTLATIKEGITQSLAIYFKTSFSSEISNLILSIFKSYDERKMRQAIEELHRSGAITLREKKWLNKGNKFFENYETLTAYYRISGRHQCVWKHCRLNPDFTNKLAIMLEEGPREGLNGSQEMNCFLLEQNTCGTIDIIREADTILTGLPDSVLHEQQLSVLDLQMLCHLKTGTIGWKMKGDMKNITDVYKDMDYKTALNTLLRNAIVKESIENLDLEKDDVIVSHLKTKKESGSSFRELQNITGLDIETLQTKLTEMESRHIICRVGYFENRILLSEFSEPWTLNINDKRIIPTPWLRYEMDIKPNIFIKWTGKIVNVIFKKPGSSIAAITDSCEYLSSRAVQDICTVLEKAKCVTLKYVDVEDCDLFSDDFVSPIFTDYNPYGSVDNILIFPVPDLITRFAYLRKLMRTYEYEHDAELDT